MKKIQAFIKAKWIIILINILFISLVLLFIKLIPFNAAPDELTHYKYNVEFLIENKRLPVSGIDDAEAYKTCGNNNFGKIPCQISYVTYPGLNYVVSAVSAVIFKNLLGLEYTVGARLASLAWGILFINSLYLIAREFIKSKKRAALTTIAIGFIPQVIFISSYINQDIHSLAISTFLIFSFIRLIKLVDTKNILRFALAFGLLFSAKYNYFVYIPFALISFLILFKKKHINLKQLIKIGLFSLAGMILISGFWYFRNIVNYGDPTGQNFMLTEMYKNHEPGRERNLNSETFNTLISEDFFTDSFKSFFGHFGYMNVPLPQEVFQITFFGILSLFILLCIKVFSLNNRRAKFFLLYFLSFTAATFLLFLFNTLKFDYQAQGRYMFPIIAPFAALLSYLVSLNKGFFKFSKYYFCLTFYLIIQSVIVLIKTYHLITFR